MAGIHLLNKCVDLMIDFKTLEADFEQRRRSEVFQVQAAQGP